MTQRTLVAHQPTYLPYLGLLHKVARASVFVVQDDLKYVKDEVSNRNRIQADTGWKWLTIPVHRDNSSTYASVTVADEKWPESHRRVLDAAYRHAPHRDRLAELHELNSANRAAPLSFINLATIRWLVRLFAIDSELVVESELVPPAYGNPNDRLISLCTRFGCDRYLSGLGGHGYIDLHQWEAAGLRLDWTDFVAHPYDRGGAEWIPNLSAIDAVAWVDDLPALLH